MNPAHGLRKVHIQRKPHKPWPAEVITAFLNVASEPLRLALHLLLYTGQRVGDVVVMKWADLSEHGVKVVQEKTGERLEIAVHGRLAAILSKTPRHNDFILNNTLGRPYKNADALSGVIKRVLIDDLEGAGHLTTHGLRKNAGIALAEAGCTVPEIQAVLGHRTPQMALHYARDANKRDLAASGVRKRERAGAA